MKEISITQEKLAEHLGKTQGAIGHWLNGRREPSVDDIAKIMKFLRMKEITLTQDGDVNAIPVVGNNFAYAGSYTPTEKYPLISWVRAGAWDTAEEPMTMDDFSEWLESEARIIGKGFWLRIEGDSMTAPMGMSIPDGTLVLFDTGREAENGNLVIAKLTDSNEATFKKLIVDGGRRYLRGLNPQWPMVEVNGNCRIIGVAVQTMVRLF
ncbi:LexA family protein [Serratia symbiotica]|uniref:LexA family protein n=1 Tax=Serratia symbiotica TaxID=138074 RepID=UPI0021F363FB|nr:LexA family transcriptional regulator [Serratia symbiotica]